MGLFIFCILLCFPFIIPNRLSGLLLVFGALAGVHEVTYLATLWMTARDVTEVAFSVCRFPVALLDKERTVSIWIRSRSAFGAVGAVAAFEVGEIRSGGSDISRVVVVTFYKVIVEFSAHVGCSTTRYHKEECCISKRFDCRV